MDERLIEVSFPLQQTSLDSVHEKNVRHGHISTLHIWPARRPLAACRAALIATLLSDPGTTNARKDLLLRMAGRIVPKMKAKKQSNGKTEQQATDETEGGILHWGRETNEDLNWFRQKIREAYGGRAPRVLDPFAGGGAIPLEAMRLGCEATAVDINPVSWFILKCTLEYPQKLAGQHLPLPEFVLQSREFMEGFLKSKGIKGPALKKQLALFGLDQEQQEAVIQNELITLTEERASIDADLAWHVRAWGWWVLQQAKVDLARFYPIINNKPTVAYLWARTVICKNCRATVPLLKTRWLCKKEKKRVALTMEPNTEKTGVVFGIWNNVPVGKGSVAKCREYDKQVGSGTMSNSGATCPCCGIIMKMEDIRQESLSGKLGAQMTSVVIDGENEKEYRLPEEKEIHLLFDVKNEISKVFTNIPFGLPEESTPGIAGRKRSSSSLRIYGLMQWKDIFTDRQLLALGTFIYHIRSVSSFASKKGYSSEWVEAIIGYLAVSLDRLAERNSCVCHYDVSRDSISGTFQRYALPIAWDFAETMPIGNTAGGYEGQLDWIARFIEHAVKSIKTAPDPKIRNQSAIGVNDLSVDLILTDPPYYDAIIYSDLMDFFYIWLKRTLNGLSPEIDKVFSGPLAPKWDHKADDGELIDDPGRHGWDFAKSQKIYEDGMARVFQNCHSMLTPDGRLVIVFAHKHPDAWETLVSAIIRAGFVVTGSWPIQTEMGNRTRALSSAALASSIWLVCKKRPEGARPGWDNKVLDAMRHNITEKLHNFWDAGIRGPDFVWAATGPALEAYSQHPLVRMSNEPGQTLSVSKFLNQARRIVLDFVVGQVLPDGQGETSPLDAVTTYYLLHRYYFGTESVPIGPCILYAVSCGLSDSDLINRYGILARSGGLVAKEEHENEEGGNEEENNDLEEEGTSSAVRLRQWYQRKSASLGYGTPSSPVPPLIDQIHRLMFFWEAGEESKLSEYLVEQGLGQNTYFPRLLQALIELEGVNSEEKGILERISNYVRNHKIASNPRLF